MKAKALLTAILVILLAGCSLRGGSTKTAARTPATPPPSVTPAPAPVAAPPPKLSIPQTSVELPKPQPIPEDALPPETAPEPEPEPPPAAPPRVRRPAPPAAPPVETAPPPAAVTPEPRETFQEIVSESEIKRLQERAQSRRREAAQILDQLSRHAMSPAQKTAAATIRNFIDLSQQAEHDKDMRKADALAERAQILAKEQQSGR